MLHEYSVAGLAPSFFQKLVVLLDLKCFLQGHIYNAFTRVNSLKLVSYKQQNFCFSFWTPWPNLHWFGVSSLDAWSCSPPSLWCKSIWNSTVAVSHGNLRGKSHPGGCNPVEITMTFQFRNTFPSGVKRLWMRQMVFRFWERLGGSWCKFYCHNCLSLPSWKLWQHCASKIALTRIENYLIGELRWCTGQMLRGS